MVAVIVKNQVKKENQKTYIEVSLAHKAATLKNDTGCIAFEVAEPNGDEVMFFELWDNMESLDAHAAATLKREHIATLNTLRYDKDLKIHTLIS